MNFAGVVREEELRRRGAGWEKFLSVLVEEQEALRADPAPSPRAGRPRHQCRLFSNGMRRSSRKSSPSAMPPGCETRSPATARRRRFRGGILAARVLAPFLRGEIDAAGLEASYRLAYAGAFRAQVHLGRTPSGEPFLRYGPVGRSSPSPSR